MSTVTELEVEETTVRRQAAGLSRYCSFLVPAALLALSLILPHYMFRPGQIRPGGQGLGPAAWPDGILTALGVFASLWLLVECRGFLRGRYVPSLQAPVEEDGYDYGKAILGIGLILLYGWMLQVAGFAVVTAAFLAVWCVYGGIRSPWVIIPVSLLGTAILLWVFMGLALMPLSRGQGVFDTFSVWLLQTLRIY